MKYTIQDIAKILGAEATFDTAVEHLLTDSRRVYSPANSLFFALRSERANGHRYIPDLYAKGVRAFIVSEGIDHGEHAHGFAGADFIKVQDTLAALQEVAARHRRRFNIPVIGITGSNGKTIVKEWLYQLLQEDYNIVRSPRSYNSQTGVPLSVWEMNEQHTLAIFEAGISLPGEMDRLEYIIQPGTGVFTNLGAAHSEGFIDLQAKANEKVRLFRQAGQIIFNNEQEQINGALLQLYRDIYKHGEQPPGHFTWGSDQHANLRIIRTEQLENHTVISAIFNHEPCSITILFLDHASVENAITCWCVMLMMGVSQEVIGRRMLSLQPLNMRLELRDGINQCTVINDSYSADADSLSIALNFLEQQSQGLKKTVILSDLLQSAEPDEQLYPQILAELMSQGVTRLIAIGPRISAAMGAIVDAQSPGMSFTSYQGTDQFIQQFRPSQYREEIILVKGARVFGFEAIVQLLEFKQHQTLLEINLNAIVANLKVYQQQLKPATKVMAMVKAFAYGAGGAEIAGILQYHKVDYLGVAYADEGVELRKAGITLPIMVMNAEPRTFESIVEHNLEPDLYSMEILDLFSAFLATEGITGYPVHLEIETGMNRLGFTMEEVAALGHRVANDPRLSVQSVFTHLAASDDAAEDDYSLKQFELYTHAADQLQAAFGKPFIRHISNSAAIFRLPQLQLDMVRLGIGLYGVDSGNAHQSLLTPAATLKTTIAQIKHQKAGTTISYNRRGRLDRDSVIATVRIGYADGYSRRFGNGVGRMLVNGAEAPVTGTVNMDMTMIDVTDIPGASVGDDVIVFGPGLPVQQVAAWAGTIPYEIMTGISQRVQRVYFEE